MCWFGALLSLRFVRSLALVGCTCARIEWPSQSRFGLSVDKSRWLPHLLRLPSALWRVLLAFPLGCSCCCYTIILGANISDNPSRCRRTLTTVNLCVSCMSVATVAQFCAIYKGEAQTKLQDTLLPDITPQTSFARASFRSQRTKRPTASNRVCRRTLL